jgi:DNA-binding TFAR19-related protein (PDSD5 family)
MNDQIDEQFQAELELAKNLKIIENVAKSKMSKEAISRYGNLKIAHPDKAVKAISFIAQAVQAGQIQEMITDRQFKELLVRL